MGEFLTRQRLKRIALGAVVLLSISYAGCDVSKPAARPEKWAQPVVSSTLENWYKLDGDVYRSEQPTRAGFEDIRKMGIQTIIDLRAGHTDADLIKGMGFTLIEVPMTATGFGTNDVVKALRAIKDARKPVLIHCQYGADRTGLVAAMYRIVFEDWTKDDAIAELTQGGFGFHIYYVNIPMFIGDVNVAKIKAEVGLQ